MNKTWKDKIIGKMGNIIKKHKILKGPMLICVGCISCIYGICNAFTKNTKRLTSMVAVLLIFVISSSFTFPSYSESYELELNATEDSQKVAMTVLNQESYSYASEMPEIAEENILDDNDVIEGYDNEELDDLDIMTDTEQFSLDDILEANEDLELSEQNQVTENSQQESGLSADDWQLLLINKQHPVPDDYTFTLGNITGSMQCDVRIIDDLLSMLQAAKEDGVNLIICSPYRDYNRQTVLFNRKINSYMNMGYSYMEAYKIASQTVTVPGASEHQIGLAVDIISDTYNQLNTGFGETEAGIWLREHGMEYGFILRYPLGKEYITGIQYEPWHFRYVGKEAAPLIMNQGLTLEEFLEQLED